eukprot:SM006670S20125  [mRNA]  locus=s6670:12:788:- [translate_table: standard]
MLRGAGCALPVEVWHVGAAKLPPHLTWMRSSHGVTLRDLAEVAPDGDGGLPPPRAKPLEIIHSRFREVLLLEPDSLPVVDPAYLFDDPKYRAAGALFWPDHFKTSPHNPIWTIVGVGGAAAAKAATGGGWEQAAGAVLVNKERSWEALQVAAHLGAGGPHASLIARDADVFRLAWLALGKAAAW